MGPGSGGRLDGRAERVGLRVGTDVRVVADTARAPFHPGRCARLELADGTVVGHAGELHPKVLENIGLPARTVAFEVDLSALVAGSSDEPVQATPVSGFPAAKEDLAFVVDDDVTAQALRDAIVDGAGDLVEEVALFDVFTGAQVGAGRKSLAFSLRLRAADRTLTADDVARVREGAVTVARERVGAELRA